MTRDRLLGDDPLPFYAELRDHRPVLETPEVTLVTRFADCAEVLRRHDLFSVALYKTKQGTYWMAQDDTAEHQRQKSVMYAVLDREDVPGIRREAAYLAASALDAADGGPVDAIATLTRAVPVELVRRRFGFADAEPADMLEWSYWNQRDAFWNQPFDDAFVDDPTGVVARREAANVEMRSFLIDLVQRRTVALEAGRPVDDMATRLLRLSNSGAVRFDPAAVMLNLGGLLIGTVETTSHAVVNALEFLSRDPDRLAAARAAARAESDGALDALIFEALRFRPAFRFFFRRCERDTPLARGTDYERTIPSGKTVLAVTHAAMFDPAAFDGPDEFAPGRSPTNTFHFGLGLHECLGRAIGAAMIPEIVRSGLLLEDWRPAAVERRPGTVPHNWSWTWETPASDRPVCKQPA
ncbi:cytochrome P450 [Alienimonas californiensis]|nr:cytochrome P450 [Alienimonas californiensis]